ALAAGAATLEDLISAAYDDTPAELHGLARLQLRAHLRRLAPDFPGA
ncbi:MAG: MBL fold metallo-hydrolase, partial [Candidatus Hydrogenedens sp.]|nr:MBL fold metallo-hydrolase [Candidatus Hydrogenedens sp.]